MARKYRRAGPRVPARQAPRRRRTYIIGPLFLESALSLSRHIVVVAAVAASTASAQDSLPRRLPPVVTVTRDLGRSPLALPYAISTIRPDSVAPGQTHTL